MIEQTLHKQRLHLDEPSKRSVFDFFANRVNNALFRHQALTWAAELGANVHLWGRGWERHSKFAKFSKGIACNESQLSAIYQASKINLQLTPTGAVHQRLFDGLAAGGFFLIRYCPGDVVEPIYRRLHEWCIANNVQDDQTLHRSDDADVQKWLKEIQSTIGTDAFSLGQSFLDVLRLSADGGYIRSAASIWPEYPLVSFESRMQMQSRVEHFLKNPQQRQELAQSMRTPVIERFSYAATSRRLLEFIADDLQKNSLREAVAA
jgi:hypothetical protein